MVKQRTDKVLLAVFLGTAALYAFIWVVNWELVPLKVNTQSKAMWEWMTWRFHAVPCFCLQLLLCRKVKWVLVRLLPVLALVGIVGFHVAFILCCQDLNVWLWCGMVLLLCAAPAAGVILGWIAYGFWLAFKP